MLDQYLIQYSINKKQAITNDDLYFIDSPLLSNFNISEDNFKFIYQINLKKDDSKHEKVLILPLPFTRNHLKHILESLSDTVASNIIEEDSLEGNILIVDDNPLNQEVLKEICESKGLKVYLANNGLEGVNIYKSKKPKVVFMDLQMPLMDGISATIQIKKINHNVKLYILTANTSNELKEKCLSSGALQVIEKPFNINIITDILKKNFKAYSKKDSLNKNISNVENTDFLSSIPEIINKDSVSKYTNNNKKIFDTSIKQVLKQCNAIIKKSSLSKSEAHKLASSSGFMGLDNLSNLCKKYEAAKKENDDDFSESIINECNIIINAFNDYTFMDDNAPNTNIKKKATTETLQELLTLCIKNSSQAIDFHLLHPEILSIKEWETIDLNIKSFKFKKAAEILENIINERF